MGDRTDTYDDERAQTLHKMNHALCNFATRWKVDGDYLRCKKCNVPVLASFTGTFRHAEGCKRATTSESFPWRSYMQILAPIYAIPPVSAQSVEPVAIYQITYKHNPKYKVKQWEDVSAEDFPEIIDSYEKRILYTTPPSAEGARDSVLQEAATRAALHSQYPVTTDFDRGYSAGRADAAAAIRSLKSKKES